MFCIDIPNMTRHFSNLFVQFYQSMIDKSKLIINFSDNQSSFRLHISSFLLNKPCIDLRRGYMCVKTITYFPTSSPTIDGIVSLFDSKTGRLLLVRIGDISHLLTIMKFSRLQMRKKSPHNVQLQLHSLPHKYTFKKTLIDVSFVFN